MGGKGNDRWGLWRQRLLSNVNQWLDVAGGKYTVSTCVLSF